MIRLYDGQITDLLLNEARYDPEVMSLSYAVLQEKRRLMDNVNGTRTLAVINELPEKVLDLLSVELKTPAYDEQFPIEIKRALIKGALSFHAKLGTPDAVNWLIGAIFGSGKIEEWFDYGGAPHHFRVSVRKSGSLTDIDSLYQFFRLIGRVKRLSSHLEAVIINADPVQAPLRVGVRGAIISRLAPTQQPDDLCVMQTVRVGGQGAIVASRPSVQQPDSLTAARTLRVGGQGGIAARRPSPQQPDKLSVTRTLRVGGALAGTAFRAVPVAPDSAVAQGGVRFGGQLAISSSLTVPLTAVDYDYPHMLKGKTGVGGKMGLASRLTVPQKEDAPRFETRSGVGGAAGRTSQTAVPYAADALKALAVSRIGGRGGQAAVIPVPIAPEIVTLPPMEARLGAGGAAPESVTVLPLAESAGVTLHSTIRTGGLTEISARLPVPVAPDIIALPPMKTQCGAGVLAETLTELSVPQENEKTPVHTLRTGGLSERAASVSTPEIK